MEDSQEYYTQLSEHVGTTRVAQWTQDEQRMQTERHENVTVMDGFDVADEKGKWLTYLSAYGAL